MIISLLVPDYIEEINVHKYGAHIFHTSDKDVWNYVSGLVEFNRYTNSPITGENCLICVSI